MAWIVALLAIAFVVALIRDAIEEHRWRASWREWCMQCEAPGWPRRFHLLRWRR